MKPQFIKTILISLLFLQTTIFPIFGLSRSISPSTQDLTPGTPVISVPDSDVKTPSRLRRIARKITTTVGRITLVTVLAGGTTTSFEATPGHNVALSSGKFVPVSALATKDCLHTFDGQLALSLTEGCARVVSLTTRDGVFPVYDLEVEEDHTFTVTRLGIVVHNAGHKACDLVKLLAEKSAVVFGNVTSKYLLDGKGFSSFPRLKTYLGKNKPGHQYHHIVEQNKSIAKGGKFSNEAIQNTKNVVELPSGPGSIHEILSIFYSKGNKEITGHPTMSVRNWLKNKDFVYNPETSYHLFREHVSRYSGIILPVIPETSYQF